MATTMTMQEFLILYVSVLVPMLLCRCVPLFVLKGRELPPRVHEALGLIPAAAFAALVANDLFSPEAFSGGLLQGILPFVAALPVFLVARFSNSLIWSAIAGMVAYALLLQLPVL